MRKIKGNSMENLKIGDEVSYKDFEHYNNIYEMINSWTLMTTKQGIIIGRCKEEYIILNYEGKVSVVKRIDIL